MGTSAIAAYRTPNPLVPPQYDQDMANLAQDIELTAVPTVASTSVRNSLYASAISAGKVGMRCYVTNRAGFCTYVHVTATTKDWVWEPTRIKLANETRDSAADSAGGSLIDIILTGPFVLPAGNRKIRLRARSRATLLTGGNAYPQLQVIGSGFSPSYNDIMSLAGISGGQQTLGDVWDVTASGTVSFALKGRDGHPTTAQSVRFTNSILQVYDLGPTDD